MKKSERLTNWVTICKKFFFHVRVAALLGT